MTPTIIILALIAAFLGLRLYTMLGKHGGHDQGSILPRAEERPRTAPPVALPTPQSETPRAGGGAPAEGMVYEPAAEIGIRAILQADRGFSVGSFVTGAQGAYRLILEAFWRGDRDALNGLCDGDSYQAFADAITAREAKGDVLDNRLVTIDSAVITAASVGDGLARITVRFKADIAAITRDAAGKMIAGSMTDAVETTDVWGFVRPIASADPNWLLDETDAG